MSVYTAALISNHSSDAVRAILEVHLPQGGKIADVTYGYGRFWRKIDTSTICWLVTYDLYTSDVERAADVKADCRSLPYRKEVFDCVFLDPPWGALSNAISSLGGLNEAYNLKPDQFHTEQDLFDFYADAMQEAYRVLVPKGTLVVKCQDFVNSKKKHWLTWHIHEVGRDLGMISEDALIQVNPNRPIMRHTGQQQHFRANYSTYIILKKPKTTQTVDKLGAVDKLSTGE